MASDQTFTIPPELDGHALPAALRKLAPSLSWSQAKRAISGRRVEINSTLCLNGARRLKAGDLLTLLAESRPPVPREQSVRILHIDPDVIVIDKPPGVITVRPRDEEGFTDEQRDVQPTLEELVRGMLPGGAVQKKRRGKLVSNNPPLYVVHRLDRNTSGLMLFALSVRAREAFIDLFSRHAIDRTYIAVALGKVEAMTIESWIVRDRGDGIRGSLPNIAAGLRPAEGIDAKRAVTHVRPIEAIGNDYTVIQCRLESGRTHQIRIHLAEAGHMLCGEKLYIRPRADAPIVEDLSGAPRQALHSTELRFTHPITKRAMEFTSALPNDLQKWLDVLKGATR
jgi:23S rRNA pseudouridine1911/1915/1917 synthase